MPQKFPQDLLALPSTVTNVMGEAYLSEAPAQWEKTGRPWKTT